MGSEFIPNPGRRSRHRPQRPAEARCPQPAPAGSDRRQAAQRAKGRSARLGPAPAGPRTCPFRAGAASSGAAAAEPNSGQSCDDVVELKFARGDVFQVQACRSLRVDWSLFTAEGSFLDQQNDKTSQQGERQLANGVIGHIDKMGRESTD